MSQKKKRFDPSLFFVSPLPANPVASSPDAQELLYGLYTPSEFAAIQQRWRVYLQDFERGKYEPVQYMKPEEAFLYYATAGIFQPPGGAATPFITAVALTQGFGPTAAVAIGLAGEWLLGIALFATVGTLLDPLDLYEGGLMTPEQSQILKELGAMGKEEAQVKWNEDLEPLFESSGRSAGSYGAALGI